MGDRPEAGREPLADCESWHQADRTELKMTFLEPTRVEDWGGLAIALPDRSTLTLVFRKDGSLSINAQQGCWQLGADGSLELEVKEPTRIVKERIWFRKPNLRLRCTLEQSLDGQPGRASFSSEIRRLSRSPS